MTQKSVAVVGAGSDRRKFGNKAVRAYVKGGYQVFPIHPSETEVEGLPVFRSVGELPIDKVDIVTLYLPPVAALKVLPTLDPNKMGRLILNPGVDSPEVLAKAEELKLPVVTGCSIIMGGFRPEQFPDE